jgi:hypothetical protein
MLNAENVCYYKFELKRHKQVEAFMKAAFL